VADAGNARLRTISRRHEAAALDAGHFNTMSGVAADASGNVYVADKGAHVIRKMDAGTKEQYIVAGQLDTPGALDGPGLTALFDAPSGIAWGAGADAGFLYIADTGNHIIRKIDLGNNALVTTIAGNAGVYGCADGLKDEALFNHPGGIVVDGKGVLYLADTGNSIIREIKPTGMVVTIAGDPGKDGIAGVPGFKDDIGTRARFNGPVDVALGGDGEYLYVADTGNKAIRKIDANDAVFTLPLTRATGSGSVPDGNGEMAENSGTRNGGGAPSIKFFAAVFILMFYANARNKRNNVPHRL
jgi:DNA-binding beta-propeller fold protein YncE